MPYVLAVVRPPCHSMQPCAILCGHTVPFRVVVRHSMWLLCKSHAALHDPVPFHRVVACYFVQPLRESRAIPCNPVPSHALSFYCVIAVLFRASATQTLCHTTWPHATPYGSMPYHAVTCRFLLLLHEPHAILCNSMPFYVVLCHFYNVNILGLCVSFYPMPILCNLMPS